jgi:O-antigen/teichoic acid export membrane protein
MYYVANKATAEADSYFTTGIVIAFLISIPITILGFYLIPYFLTTQNPRIVPMAQLFLWFIPLAIFSSFLLANIQAKMEIRLWNFIRIVSALLWIFPLSILFIFDDVDANFVAKTYLLTLIAQVVFIVLLTRNKIPKSYKIQSNLVMPIIKYSLPTTLSSYIQQSSLKLDQIFIVYLLSPEILGYYVISIAWSGVHTAISTSVSSLIVPSLGKMTKATKKNFLIKISRVSFLINCLMALIMIIVTPVGIKLLFGDDFSPAVPISYVLILGSIFANMKYLYTEVFRGLDLPKYPMFAELLGLIILGVFFFILIPLIGVVGVAIASLIGYFATFSFLLYRVSKLYNLNATDLIIPQSSDVIYIYNKSVQLLKSIYGKFSSL